MQNIGALTETTHLFMQIIHHREPQELNNISFEGVCVNYRHPGHRRAWKGGSEPQLLTPLPRDRADEPPLKNDPSYFIRRRST